MMTVTDATFAEFLDVVDRFEGQSIRAVSDAAAPAVQLFMDDSASPTRLLIEVVEEDVLEVLPRLSRDMQALFTDAGGS